MAMAFFRAICRGLEYKSHSENFAPVHLEWSGTRAWSLHFVSLCTSSLGSRFELTIITTAATCLRTLFELENSYYRIIPIDTALLPALVELSQESCRSRCHAAVRYLSYLLSITSLHFEGALQKITGLLEKNPKETAKHCVIALLEDSLGEHDYSDSDSVRNTVLLFMMILCRSQSLAEAIIHMESVQLTCDTMRQVPTKLSRVHIPLARYLLYASIPIAIDFINMISLQDSNLRMILTIIDSHLLEVLLQLAPSAPPKYERHMHAVIANIIYIVGLYAYYRSVTRGLKRCIASVVKKSIIVNTEYYSEGVVGN